MGGFDADVIVIGGGPAASTLGCYLARAGIRTILLERENHPREHIGESLVNATTRIFNEIGFLETMEREGFIRKYGGTWTGFQTRQEANADIRFVRLPEDGITQEYSYHVDRSRFDALMFKHAEADGTTNVQGANVLRVLFDDAGGANGVRVRILERELDLRSRFVVDASGRKTVLGSQLGLKRHDPAFNQFALYSWFQDVTRREGIERDFIRIFFLPTHRSWAWQIPITDEITSVGVVTDKATFRGGRNTDAFFSEVSSANPNLHAALRGARRVRPFRTEGDYSYSMSRFAGPGWLLVGDACRFVDPIFSSGVSVAMYSAKFASEAIAAAMAGEEGSAFDAYEDRVRRGVDIWYEFISLYYRLMHLFTWFTRSSDEHRQDLIRLLQGLVFDRTEVKLLDVWKDMIRSIEANPRHLLHGQLMALTGEGDVVPSGIPSALALPERAHDRHGALP
jgi:flavin-dependent dehydrogenase